MRPRKTIAVLLLLAPLLVVVAIRATNDPVLSGALVTKRHVVLQRTASDCGLAALATIAAHTGVSTEPYVDLLERHPPGTKGFSLAALAKIGEELGLMLAPYGFQPDELDRVPLPALLHLSEQHFVVLVERGAVDWYVADPAVGLLRVNGTDLKRAFGGTALLLAEMSGGEGAGTGKTDLP